MTILIGFTCHDALVVASDSQTTFSPTTSKQNETQKIFFLDIGGEKWAIIAKAGALDYATLFQEAFGQKAKSVEWADYRSLANLAEAAMREVRAKVVSLLRQDGLVGDEFQRAMWDRQCEILLGYFYAGTPYLFALRLNTCAAVKCVQGFEALGCASNVASVALAGHDLPKMDPRNALALAAYAVEVCKTHDSACGGPVQLALLGGDGKQHFIWNRETSAMISEKSQAAMSDVQASVAHFSRKHFDELGIFRPHDEAEAAKIDAHYSSRVKEV